jgi:hypothetical protein
VTSLLEAGSRCPKCRDAIEDGYGLAGGGFGAYQYCLNEACDWFVKDRECPVCEMVGEHAPDCAEAREP